MQITGSLFRKILSGYYGINSDGRFACLAVTDDQFTLTTTDGIMASMGLMPSERLIYRLTEDHTGSFPFQRHFKSLSCDLTFSINGFTKRIDNRPKRPSPTSIEAILRVLLTISPSFNSYASPKRTAPILSSSRFNTIAFKPFFSNSISSPDSALLSP